MGLLFQNEERDARTEAAMQMPMIGDVFEEMLNYWVVIVAVSPRRILTVEAVGPCTLPKGGKLHTYSPAEEFRKHFAYDTIPGYSIALDRSGVKVEGWLEALHAREEPA